MILEVDTGSIAKFISFRSGKSGSLTQLYSNIGLCYQAIKNYNSAISFFSKVLEHPTNPSIYIERGLCYRKQGNFQAAIRDFSEVGGFMYPKKKRN